MEGKMDLHVKFMGGITFRYAHYEKMFYGA